MGTLQVSGQNILSVTGSPATATLNENVNINDTLAGATFPAGHIIQMVGDTYNPGTYIDVTTSDTLPIGSNVEVSITFKSTSNKFFAQMFIPDVYSLATTNYLNCGFQYSTDNFGSGSVLGVQQVISDHVNYQGSTHNDLQPENYMTFGNVPTTTACKIRPYIKAVNGNVRLNANNLGVYCLIVKEIQG